MPQVNNATMEYMGIECRGKIYDNQYEFDGEKHFEK